MRIRALASLAVFCLSGLALSSAACSSVPEVTFSDDAGGSSGTSGTSGGFDGGDGSTPPDGAPGCVKTGPEICDDGVDNDCNGQTDCADTACQPNYQCVDRAPAGFELIAVSDVRTTACAAGYTDQADLEILVGGAPSCACKCTEVGGSCTSGTVDITSSTESSCTGGTTTTKPLNRTQTACAALPGGMAVGPNNQRFEAAATATQPASCTPGSTLTLPTQLSGRTCKPPAAPNAGGCAPTQACVRKPAAGFAICAVRPATAPGTPASCAGAYTNRRRGGTSLTNTATCNETACGCNNSACTGTLTLFDTANCATGATAKSEDIPTGASGSACLPMSVSGGAWNAIAYKATAGGGCAPTGAATVTGSLDLANETTICCKP